MLSALCIRRPVMTILVMASFIIAGIFGYKQLPVAAIPRVDFPTIQVTAQLPGASPETMAASVASILERQFSTIAGVTSMTSTSSLGNTSIVLQFDLNRNIDGAALDVQSAISSSMRRLPVELPTPPSFRKVNPADYAIMFMALSSSQVRLSDIDAFANRSILPRLSTLPGMAQVLIFGTQKYAVRVRANLDQLAVRGLTLNELQTAIVNANSTKPLGAIADQKQNAILDATRPDQQGGRLQSGDRRLPERCAGAHLRRRHLDRQCGKRQGGELAERHARHPARLLSPARRQYCRGRRPHQGHVARRSAPSCRAASASMFSPTARYRSAMPSKTCNSRSAWPASW